MDAISLVVGLGNPGSEYARTRHNAGFMVVEQVAAGLSARWMFEKRFSAQVAKADRDGQRVMLAEPQTYMNASGEAVAALLNFLSGADRTIAGGGGRCRSAARRIANAAAG